MTVHPRRNHQHKLQSGVPQHADVRAQAQTNSTAVVLGPNVPVVPTSTALLTSTPKAQIRSSTPTERAAEPTTLGVPPQAMHARSEGSQMDVRSMTVAGRDVWNLR